MLTAFILLVSGIVMTSAVAQPAQLPVRDGLILWLDAAAQPAARTNASLPPLTHSQPIDFLLDASGSGRHVAQTTPERRPVFISHGATAYLKFDGQDDFLAVHGPRESTPELTVFLLAAPKTNSGNFSALFVTTQLGRNDYMSGLNFDFGPVHTTELSVLNVESPGAGGFRDLLVPGLFNAVERPFGDFHVFTARSKAGKDGIEVFLDGFKGGTRDRDDSRMGLDQMAIGARLYSHDAGQPPFARGFFDGAIAEVLVYNRALSDAERGAVENALHAKIPTLQALLHGAKGHALETVKDPPVVQMLVPGFTVRELPLPLKNLNNIRYRHDGKLVALGYNGQIHLLTDTNGDGLEDKAELFWDEQTFRGPIGMALTPKDYPLGDGVFVASKGKVSLVIDKDRDGRADEEIVVAKGWPEAFHSVDTLGVAIDPKDGSVYFGLGTPNFADGYLIDRATGRSRYDLQDIRGTIQKLSADFTRQETVCTGVRFTCALAFNRHGDLFATDQEGATWLPNGNPFDELLHIQPGKHYGFPPRHPKHLPGVIDEPAVFEYGPQHQSTVGLVFNEGVNGGPHFGPAHWKGDALICGQSRGKIYRTKLAKTPLGYVAQNHIIACLSLLTIDSCVTPQGDLLVVCHSGPPDWGTGPAGDGRIFKISYTGRTLPQPVLAWAAAPDEFRIAFDRPLDPADWANAKDRVKIEAGQHVAAGDRFEILRPGYQIVRDQIATPRRWVQVLGLTLSEDRRTMSLRVVRQTEAVSYAIMLPAPESWRQNGGIAQHPQIDVAVTLNGIAAGVTAPGGMELRTVLPHASLDASEILTLGSAEHETFLTRARAKDATLALRGSVDVSNPFVPAVQPGSKLDWDMASDSFASALFAVAGDFSSETKVNIIKPPATNPRPAFQHFLPLSALSVMNPKPSSNGLFLVKDDLRHPVSTTRLHLPWAAETGEDSALLAKERTDVKGNWLRGRRIYFGEAGCATCHTIRGEGVAFGPDLSNLIFRDRESVLHDILQPSAAINPDQAGTLVTLEDGTILPGLVRSLDEDKLVLGLPAGAQVEIARGTVASMEPMKNSLMPDGLCDNLSAEELEDLLSFLLLNPLDPTLITRTDPPMPPARGRNEIIEVLGALPTHPVGEQSPLHLLLCAGPKTHGIDEHDYPLWLERWSRLLALGDNVTVTTAMGFPTEEQLAEADVTVFYNSNPGWLPIYKARLDRYHQRGGGVVYIHFAVEGGTEPDQVAERVGLVFTLGSRFRHGEMELAFPATNHPITRGFPTLRFTDETYWNMRGDLSRLNILGESVEDGSPRPQLWTLERDRSRIVGFIPGHYMWSFDDPLLRILVFRSICWAARQPEDRLNELITVGARVGE
jgi:putative heme-binding domain-containing protein